MLIRKPHVAGSFYPSDPTELREFCQKHLASQEVPVRAKAVILPHAGYVYSGRTACRTLSNINVPENVVLTGPDHFGAGPEFSLFPRGAWENPLGSVPVAEDLASALLESSHDIHADENAHRAEHSLEVLLPFLQFKNPDVKITPLLAGTLDFDLAARVSRQMGEILALKMQTQDVLVVISNDMSHYEPEDATRRKDQYALEAILKLDARELLKAIQLYKITMCGMVPVFMLLTMKDYLGITKARLVEYTTSAEASGDRSRVVGYAGFIFE